jgi:hypothetical protein
MLQAIVHSTSLIFLSICSGHSRRATKKTQYRVVILARVLIVDEVFSRLFFSFSPSVNNCLQQENPLTNVSACSSINNILVLSLRFQLQRHYLKAKISLENQGCLKRNLVVGME